MQPAATAWSAVPVRRPRGHDARRNAYRDGVRLHVVAHDRTCPDDGVVADRDAVKHLRAGSQPGTVADGYAGRRSRLSEDRRRRIREVVVAADHIAVRG